MKTEILRFLVCICFAILFVHVTVTPFIITRALNQPSTQTELVRDCVNVVPEAQRDSVNGVPLRGLRDCVIKPSNAEIYESK